MNNLGGFVGVAIIVLAGMLFLWIVNSVDWGSEPYSEGDECYEFTGRYPDC